MFSQQDLAIFEDLSNLRVEYRRLFGHDVMHECYPFIELKDKPALLRKIIDSQDETILDSLFTPVPLDADI